MNERYDEDQPAGCDNLAANKPCQAHITKGGSKLGIPVFPFPSPVTTPLLIDNIGETPPFMVVYMWI